MSAPGRNRLRFTGAAMSLDDPRPPTTVLTVTDKRRSARFLVFVLALLGLNACTAATEIRFHNASTLDYAEIEVGGEPFGELVAGTTGEYRSVSLRAGYAALSFKADGQRVTGQALSLGARRYTWRIDVVDLAKGWLDIEVVREDDPAEPRD